MKTATKQVEELAEKYALIQINNLDWSIFNRNIGISKITVDFLNKFMVTKIKYPDHSRIELCLQMAHDFPETAGAIYKTTNKGGYGIPIDEIENVHVYCGKNDSNLGRSYISERLEDIMHLTVPDPTAMDRARIHILHGQMGKRVDSSLKKQYMSLISINA